MADDRGADPGGRCLDDNALLDLVEGRLDEARRDAVLAHTDRCESCRALMVETLRAARGETSAASEETASAVGSGGPGTTAALLRQGDRIGRYVVLGMVGAGGMGVVYAAFDPELDRKVALKLLRLEESGSEGGDGLSRRLLREAQAMARLSHPNIVTVFDAGTYEGRVFLAMDFVVGETFSQWLARGGHARRAILDVLVQAGRGLAAAHAAGIVHRDFKPDNVLVREDGRVLVSDFGLARSVGGGDDGRAGERPFAGTALPSPGSGLATPLTLPGAVAGTPAYMAPEQAAGHGADARTDLFAFCVTAYEALVGRRPFAGRSVEELRVAMGERRVEPEPSSRVLPGYLRRALLRGLHPDPGSRLQSMAELLGVLEHDRRRFWIRAALGAGVLLLLGGAVLLQAALHDDPASRCDGGEVRLARVWDDERRAEVQAAFGALSLSFGATTAERVTAELNTYRASWLAAHRAACEATRVRGEQSETLLDRRMACLGRRRSDLRALVDVLANADAATAERAVSAVRSLAPLTTCADQADLLAAEPPPTAAVTEVLVVEELLSRARALGAAGRAPQALKVAQEALVRARVTAHRPTVAEAGLVAGKLQYEMEAYPAAEATLLTAFLDAHAGHADTIAAAALVELVYAVGPGKRDLPAAKAWARLAEAAIARVGEPPALRSRLHSGRALVSLEQHNFAEAQPELEAALRLEESLHGSDHPRVGQVLHAFGKALSEKGDYDASVRIYQRVVRIDELAFGVDHPTVADDLVSLGTAQYFRYEFAAAARSMLRSLEIKKRIVGEDAPGLWRDLNALGSVLQAGGDFERARVHLFAAVRIARKVLGERDFRLAMPLHNVSDMFTKMARFSEAEEYLAKAEALTAAKVGVDSVAFAIHLYSRAQLELGRGMLDAAERFAQRALAVREKAQGAGHPDVASARHLLGMVALRRGDLAAASAHFDEGLAAREKALGAQHPDVAESLVGLAELALLRDDAGLALRHCERAAAIQRARGGEIGTIADRRFAQARALRSLGREPADVRRLATAAVAGYLRVPYYARELAAARAFVAKLPAR